MRHILEIPFVQPRQNLLHYICIFVVAKWSFTILKQNSRCGANLSSRCLWQDDWVTSALFVVTPVCFIFNHHCVQIHNDQNALCHNIDFRASGSARAPEHTYIYTSMCIVLGRNGYLNRKTVTLLDIGRVVVVFAMILPTKSCILKWDRFNVQHRLVLCHVHSLNYIDESRIKKCGETFQKDKPQNIFVVDYNGLLNKQCLFFEFLIGLGINRKRFWLKVCSYFYKMNKYFQYNRNISISNEDEI